MVSAQERINVRRISTADMDRSADERPSELAMRHRAVASLNRLGYNLREIVGGLDEGDTKAVSSLADACALLHADWQHARRSMSSLHTGSSQYGFMQSRMLADARIYNALAAKARATQETSLRPFNTKPFEDLAHGIRENLHDEKRTGKVDLDEIAGLVSGIAHTRTHFDTFANRTLPSRARQPYTSMGILAVDAEDLPPTYVTQFAVFNPHMFAHTHGVSGAFEALNGNPDSGIHHARNITWSLHSDIEAFPLKPAHVDTYSNENGTVLFAPPRYVHSVVPVNEDVSTGHSFEEMERVDGLAKAVIDKANFGTLSSTLVFMPMRELVEKAESDPRGNIWSTKGTLAFNRTDKFIYLTDKHAMEARWSQWTSQGECCGVCQRDRAAVNQHIATPKLVEDDNREAVSYAAIHEWVSSSNPDEKLLQWQRDPITGIHTPNGVLTSRYTVPR